MPKEEAIWKRIALQKAEDVGGARAIIRLLINARTKTTRDIAKKQAREWMQRTEPQ